MGIVYEALDPVIGRTLVTLRWAEAKMLWMAQGGDISRMNAQEFVDLNGERVHFTIALDVLRDGAAALRDGGELKSAAENLVLAASILDRAGRPVEALEELRSAEQLVRASDARAYLAECLGFKARLLQEGGELIAALEVMREVESIDRALQSPELEITLEQQLGILCDLDDVVEMKRVADEFFLVATDVEAIERIHRLLVRHGIDRSVSSSAPAYDSDGFESRIRQLDAERASEAQILYQQCRGYLDLSDAVGALAAAKRLAELAPGAWESWFLKAQALGAMNLYDVALDALGEALALNNLEPKLWWLRGQFLSHLGRFEEELDCCDRILALHPDYVDALSMKAAALVCLRRYPEAIEVSRRALSIDDKLNRAWMNLGAALMGVAQYRDARQAFLKAASLGHPRAHQAAVECETHVE
jgi:tetratricopeptide (TPR) repeat protein